MTRELKRRQASLQPEWDHAPEDPPSRETRGYLAYLGRLVGIGKTVEDEAGTMAPVHRPGLYVSLVVVLAFVLATYLASSIRGADRPSVSLVQEPTVSQLPSGMALVGNVADNERNMEDVSKGNQPESPAIDTGSDERTRAERSRQEEYATQTAQVSPSSATAFASASAGASASASPTYSRSASPPATATPAPTRVRPEPAAREQRGGGGKAAPTGPPARVSGTQSLQETQAGPVDPTRLGNEVPNKVKKALNSPP